MKEIATTLDIKNLIVNVSEKINKKNISNFVQTSLSINNINYSSSDIIYCNFLEYSKQYQIFIFSNTFKYMLIELLDIENEENKKPNTLNDFKLYISKSFFVIYKDLKLYLYQVLNQEYSNDELIKFINKNFNITITSFYELSDSKINKIYENTDIKKVTSSLLNINKKSKKGFYLYLLYLVFCILIVGLYKSYENKTLEDDKLEKIKSNKEEYLKISKMLKFKPFKTKYLKLINNVNKFNLEIISLNYSSNVINLKLSTKKKDDIYLFLNEYKKDLLGNSIVKDESKNMFVSTINVKSN